MEQPVCQMQIRETWRSCPVPLLQIMHMVWGNQRMPADRHQQPWKPKFLSLKAADIYLFDQPPVSPCSPLQACTHTHAHTYMHMYILIVMISVSKWNYSLTLWQTPFRQVNFLARNHFDTDSTGTFLAENFSTPIAQVFVLAVYLLTLISQVHF